MPSAIAIFGALLDRSISDITVATEDARNYDPDLIYRRSNIWDNNTVPFLRAATSWRRERLAGVGLRWMADFSGERRRWMIDTAPAVVGLLPPADLAVAYRDRHGNVRPSLIQLITNDSISDLGLDYDLTTATVSWFAIQRTARSLDASLTVKVDRRHQCDSVSAAAAELHLDIGGVTDLRFDADSGRGISMVCHPDGVTVGIGSGIIRGAAANVFVSDDRWHLSRAGRRADAVTPPATGPVWQSTPFDCSRLSGWAATAAFVMHTAMIEIRASRHYHVRAADVDISTLSRRFHGAGRDIVDAATHHGPARERAFRDLVQTWITREPGLAESSRLWDIIAKMGLEPPERSAVSVRLTVAGTAEVVRLTYGSQGRFTGSGPREVDVHAAVPGDDSTRPWRLARVKIREAQAFGVSMAAFHRTIELDNAGGSLSSGTDGALLAQA